MSKTSTRAMRRRRRVHRQRWQRARRVALHHAAARETAAWNTLAAALGVDFVGFRAALHRIARTINERVGEMIPAARALMATWNEWAREVYEKLGEPGGPGDKRMWDWLGEQSERQRAGEEVDPRLLGAMQATPLPTATPTTKPPEAA